MHTPVWIKIGMALGFAYLAIFTIDLVGDMLGGPDDSHGDEHANVEHIAEASHEVDASDDHGAPEPAATTQEDDHGATTAHEEAAETTEVAAIVGDVAAGKKASRKCASCHSFDDGGPNKVGPNLFGLATRERGTAEGYKYSAALKSAGESWSDADLDAFLADPKGFAAGTKMSLKVRKEADRANLIAFLNSLH